MRKNYNADCHYNKSRRCRQSLLKQGFSIWTALFHTVSVCSPSHSYTRKGTRHWLRWWISSQALVLPLSPSHLSVAQSVTTARICVFLTPEFYMDWKKKLDGERDLKNKGMVAAKANGKYERRRRRRAAEKKKRVSLNWTLLTKLCSSNNTRISDQKPHKATDDRFIYPVCLLVAACMPEAWVKRRRKKWFPSL